MQEEVKEVKEIKEQDIQIPEEIPEEDLIKDESVVVLNVQG